MISLVLEERPDHGDVSENLDISDTQKSLRETEKECQEQSSHEISVMGNIKSLHSDQDTSERVLSVVNDNIKKLTTHPEYNNSPRGRDIVEQLLSIIVNAGDQHDLSENMKNENVVEFGSSHLIYVKYVE